MGWTSKRYIDAKHAQFSAQHLVELLKDEYIRWGYSFAMIHLRKASSKDDNHVCYALMKSTSGNDFINVILINIKDDVIYWKDVPESMGPCEDDCPELFFNFVEAPNKYAEEWRERCKDKHIKYNKIELYPADKDQLGLELAL